MKRSGTGFGEDYEHRVSAAIASKLLESVNFQRELKMGYEVCIKRAKSISGLYQWLNLQNVSGTFYLTCTSCPKDDWKDIFQIDLKNLAGWSPSISHHYPGGEVAVFRANDTTYDLYADDSLQEHIGNVDSISAGMQLVESDHDLEPDHDAAESIKP